MTGIRDRTLLLVHAHRGTPSLTPTLSSVSPNSLQQGATSQNLSLVGTGFVNGDASVVFSNAGVSINSTTVNSSTSITVNISVSGGASTGAGTVKVHSAAHGDSNTQTFTVSASGTVTSVTVFYNGQANPILARTGSTYALVAKDQSGNVLSGGTWSSSDPTNAPVDSSGVASPGTGSSGKGITWTYLDAGGVYSGTLSATVLKAATAIKSDYATNYSSDTNFLANVRSSVSSNGSWNSNTTTGSAGALYGDGQNANEIQLDTTRLFMGNKTLRVSLPSGGPVPILRASLGANYSRLFGFYIRRYEPGFTMVGHVVTPPGDANAYKITPWFTWPGQGDGRGGPEGTNGNSSGGTGGAPGGTFDLGVGGTNGGQSTLTTYTIQGEFSATNPQYYLDIVLYEIRSGNIISMRHFHCPMGSDVVVLNNGGLLPYGIVEGPMQAGYSPYQPNTWSPFGENYNNVPAATMWHNDYGWEVIDGTSVGDPLGIFGAQPTATLTGITGGSLTHGTTNNTVTLTGTNFNENCYPVFSNTGILAQSITLTNSTTLTIKVDVTAGASIGSGTVLVKNGASLATTSTQTVTVS